jgi:hypothetical protein
MKSIEMVLPSQTNQFGYMNKEIENEIYHNDDMRSVELVPPFQDNPYGYMNNNMGMNN